jgi:hypothetical protein
MSLFEYKGLPMRPQHFFCGINQAMKDLHWKPKYDTVEAISKDSYESDFVHVKMAGASRTTLSPGTSISL